MRRCGLSRPWLGRFTGQAPVDTPCVARARRRTVVTLELRAGRVVGAHAVPADAMACEALREQPGTDLDVGAGVVEIAFGDAVALESWQVRAVDLQQPDVVAAGAFEQPPWEHQ